MTGVHDAAVNAVLYRAVAQIIHKLPDLQIGVSFCQLQVKSPAGKRISRLQVCLQVSTVGDVGLFSVMKNAAAPLFHIIDEQSVPFTRVSFGVNGKAYQT